MAQYLTRTRQKCTPSSASSTEGHQMLATSSSLQTEWLFPYPSSAPSSPAPDSEFSLDISFTTSDSLPRSMRERFSRSPSSNPRAELSRLSAENVHGAASDLDNESDLEWEWNWSTELDDEESHFMLSPPQKPNRSEDNPRSILTISLEKTYHFFSFRNNYPDHSVDTLVLHPRLSRHNEHSPLLSLIDSILLPSLWDLVSGVWTGGGMALHNIWRKCTPV